MSEHMNCANAFTAYASIINCGTKLAYLIDNFLPESEAKERALSTIFHVKDAAVTGMYSEENLAAFKELVSSLDISEVVSNYDGRSSRSSRVCDSLESLL